MRNGLLLVTLLLAGLLSVSRSNGLAAPPASSAPASLPTTGPANSPRQAMTNLVLALEKGDRGLLNQSIFLGKADDKELRPLIIDMMLANHQLRQDIQKAYGKPVGSAGELPRPEELEKLVTKTDDDTAVITRPLDGSVFRAVRVEGVWAIDLSEKLPPPQQRDSTIATMKAGLDVVRKVRANVGKPGYDAARIVQEYKQEMGKLMGKE